MTQQFRPLILLSTALLPLIASCQGQAAPAHDQEISASNGDDPAAAGISQEDPSTQEPVLSPEEMDALHRRSETRSVDRRKHILDNPNRVAAKQPDKVVAVFGVAPGEVVADIGAGTGFFTFRLAAAVGPQGKVYATEIRDELLDALRRKAEEARLPQVTAVKSTVDDPLLPEASCDKMLLSNVYFALRDRVNFMKKARKAMKPGGRVAIVEPDFDRSLEGQDFPYLTTRRVIDEMRSAGFAFRESHTFHQMEHFLIFSAESDEGKGLQAELYDGIAVYSLPFMKSVNPKSLRLFPHYSPLRAEQGWTYAYVDLGYILTNPVLIEEMRPGAGELVGAPLFGERAYLALSGRGYTEVRKNPHSRGRPIHWKKGDMFVVPHGYWAGHANPYAEPARFISMGATLTNDLLGNGIRIVDNRPDIPFVTKLIPREQGDTLVVRNESAMDQEVKEEIVARSGGNKGTCVYRTRWGAKINLGTIQTDPSRAEAGWKSALLQPGGRILNWFVVQDIPARSAETGHRHGGDSVFFALRGKGKTVFRDDNDRDPVCVEWQEGDLFCLPARHGGIHHAHANEHGEPARIVEAFNLLDGGQLLDPQVRRVRPPSPR